MHKSHDPLTIHFWDPCCCWNPKIAQKSNILAEKWRHIFRDLSWGLVHFFLLGSIPQETPVLTEYSETGPSLRSRCQFALWSFSQQCSEWLETTWQNDILRLEVTNGDQHECNSWQKHFYDTWGWFHDQYLSFLTKLTNHHPLQVLSGFSKFLYYIDECRGLTDRDCFTDSWGSKHTTQSILR